MEGRIDLMLIEKIKYIIATKEFPLEFDSIDGGYNTDKIEEAYFYNSKEEAIGELNRFDEPDTRQVLPVKITYEI